jgi:DNA recombination protein RmuC
MDSILIFFIFVLFVIVIVLLVVIFTKLSGGKSGDRSLEVMGRWMEQMQSRLDRNADVMERNMRATHEHVAARLDKTSEVLSVVGERIGEMSEIGRSMRDLGDLLKTPKLRGNLGEYVLKDLLRQYLPSRSFEMQYAFKNGAIVDAAIKTDSGILCIDSKFPLENFKRMYEENKGDTEKAGIVCDFVRDVRKHIDAISSKYINPEEFSFDYALMYIPSEAVYYEIICNQPELMDYAHQKCVIVVSPSVFYAYLQVILISLEGRKVEDKARELLRSFKGLQIEFGRFANQFGLGVKHLSNAKNAFDTAQIQYSALETKIQTLSRGNVDEKDFNIQLPDLNIDPQNNPERLDLQDL